MTRDKTVNGFLSTRLFQRPSVLTEPSQIIGWWEARRLSYNLMVGAVGLVTILIMVTVAAICQELIGVPIGMPDPPIFAILGVIVFVLMANVCFTAGWVVELFMVQVRGLRSTRFAEITFRLGLFGSIVLTLLPAVATIVVATATLAGWIRVPSEPVG